MRFLTSDVVMVYIPIVSVKTFRNFSDVFHKIQILTLSVYDKNSKIKNNILSIIPQAYKTGNKLQITNVFNVFKWKFLRCQLHGINRFISSNILTNFTALYHIHKAIEDGKILIDNTSVLYTMIRGNRFTEHYLYKNGAEPRLSYRYMRGFSTACLHVFTGQKLALQFVCVVFIWLTCEISRYEDR